MSESTNNKMQADNEHIYDLIAKQMQKQCSVEEEQILQQWLDESPANRQLYIELAQLWDEIPAATASRPYNSRAAWLKMDARLQENDPVPAHPVYKKRYTGWIAAAAALLLLLAAGWWLFRPQPGTVMVTAAEGRIRNVQLPDGSLVTLRQGASISYGNRFNRQNRVVHLQGEAFLEVQQHTGQPFLIETDNQSVIQVLGTSFAVSATQQQTTVVVASGKVKLSVKNEENGVILKPGRKGISANGLVIEQDNADPNYLAWKTGILQFNDRPLTYILEQLAAFYGKAIRIEDSYQQAAQTQKATARFENQSWEEALHELQLLHGFEYRQEGDSFVISRH